jgi:hypothetical protein
MKLKFLPALLLPLAVTAACASALEWKTTHLELKVAPLQKTAEAWFEFTNTSPKVVKITGVDSSCDCLDATPSATVIAPGATGRINAHFSLADRYGVLRRTILVATDEGTAPTALTAELEVPEAATLAPRSVEWKIGAAVTEQAVDVTIADGIELALHAVHATSDAFTTRLETLAPGRHYRLHVTPRSTTAVANAAFRLYGKTPSGQDVVLSAYGNVR